MAKGKSKEMGVVMRYEAGRKNRRVGFRIQFFDQALRFTGFGDKTDVVFIGVDVEFQLSDFGHQLFSFVDNFVILIITGIQ